MTEIEKRTLEILKEDINNRLIELNGLAQAMELFFSECDFEQMKKERFEPSLLFAIQKRLFDNLHSQFQVLIGAP
jgi:hypothetical protein